jgi:hypothetical protein
LARGELRLLLARLFTAVEDQLTGGEDERAAAAAARLWAGAGAAAGRRAGREARRRGAGTAEVAGGEEDGE